MRIAFVASAHGFGHLTRQIALAAALPEHERVLFAAACPVPRPAGVALVPWTVDVGLVQHDSVTEDVAATAERLDAVVHDAAIDALARRLEGFDRVVVDTAPAALEAARRAGVSAVAVGNFDWAWIYQHYPSLHAWAQRFARWQAPHPAIEVWPGPGLHGFASVRRFGLIGRAAPAVRVAEKTVLVCFGGFGLHLPALPTLPGVRWVFAAPMIAPPGHLQVDDVPFPALVAGADVVLTKPGYGIFAETARAGTRCVFVHRPGFPEAPHLEAAMIARGDLPLPRLEAGALAEAVTAALLLPRPAPTPDDSKAVAGAVVSG